MRVWFRSPKSSGGRTVPGRYSICASKRSPRGVFILLCRILTLLESPTRQPASSGLRALCPKQCP